jgi:hypothetical protein
VPVGDGWLHEGKFDGYRVQQVHKVGSRVVIYSPQWARLDEALSALFLAGPMHQANRGIPTYSEHRSDLSKAVTFVPHLPDDRGQRLRSHASIGEVIL